MRITSPFDIWSWTMFHKKIRQPLCQTVSSALIGWNKALGTELVTESGKWFWIDWDSHRMGLQVQNCCVLPFWSSGNPCSGNLNLSWSLQWFNHASFLFFFHLSHPLWKYRLCNSSTSSFKLWLYWSWHHMFSELKKLRNNSSSLMPQMRKEAKVFGVWV